MKFLQKVSILLCLSLSFLIVNAGETKRPPGSGTKKPSANKGRKGSYQVETRKKKYKYWVYVPSSYSENNPAGIHLFFHGQRSSSGAQNFGMWSATLERHNLIGINMEYTDGDNQSDGGGKLDVAIDAVQQTIADYKVLHGRGIVCSFSGGGLIHQSYYNRHGKGGLKSRRSKWCFCVNALYSDNFWGSAKGSSETGWLVSLHQKEVNMGKPTIGSSQIGNADEVLSESIRGGDVVDAIFLYTKGQGHGVGGQDVAAVSELFGRTEIAFSPFIYTPDYQEPELSAAISAIDELKYGPTEEVLKKLLARPDLSPELKKKIDELQGQINRRIEKIIAFGKTLSEDDPILCNGYGEVLFKQLEGHPRLPDVQAAFEPGMKKYEEKKLRQIKSSFLRSCTKMVDIVGGGVNARKSKFLQEVIDEAGPKSQCGIMAKSLLDCIPQDKRR